MKRQHIEQLGEAIANRQATALVTWIATGDQQLLPHPDAAEADGIAIAEPLAGKLREHFRLDRSRLAEIDGDEVFIKVYSPPLRMIIIGAVHIAQALIPMARQLGYSPYVIDPRTAFASEERFADVPRDTRWPDEALAEIGVDARTAFIALTHDPKIDDPALTHALSATPPPFYVGALGGRRTNEKRIDRLTAAGLTQTQLGRINAPVGLDIGAMGAPEIAVSIIAEVTAALRGKLAAQS